jgi:hypothetical protein
MPSEQGGAGASRGRTRNQGFTAKDLALFDDILALSSTIVQVCTSGTGYSPADQNIQDCGRGGVATKQELHKTPDEMTSQCAKRRLSRTETVEKNRLPTVDEIKIDVVGEARAAAEYKLKEGRDKLKTPVTGTREKRRLPTIHDINAENSARVEAEEILLTTKKRLSVVKEPLIDKQILPTTADIDAEKKDKSCAVAACEQNFVSRQSRAKAESHGMSIGSLDKTRLACAGADAGVQCSPRGRLGLNAPGPWKQINISSEINMAWQRVLDDTAKTAWLYCKYSNDLKSLELQASGEGGLADFKKQVGVQMAWGVFRCYGVDQRGGTEVRRTKFVFVQVRPEAVSTVQKAKQAAHKGDVKNVIGNTHVDVVVESVADLDEQSLITTLQSAAGAHKPNGYEFDPGAFLEADHFGLGIGEDCKGETAFCMLLGRFQGNGGGRLKQHFALESCTTGCSHSN